MAIDPRSDYAGAGVNYNQLNPFKRRIARAGGRTLTLPNKNHVEVQRGPHGAIYEYTGPGRPRWVKTTEGLGNKNWIAEWMYMMAPDGPTWYEGIGIDTIEMAAGDCAAQGARPVLYTDEIAAGDSEWFTDERRGDALIDSFISGCELLNLALPAGETPALKYLIKSKPPVKSAPVLSGTVTGVLFPDDQLVLGENLASKNVIIGLPASGPHCNGFSLLIKEALKLPDAFFTKMPSGKMLGEAALAATRSYVAAVAALQDAGIRVVRYLPATGDGLAKLAVDERPFTYRVHSWLADEDIPELYFYLMELGLSMESIMTTFNWGMGYYIFIEPQYVDAALRALARSGYGDAMVIGVVEEGERQVVFEPAGKTFLPPED